MSNIYDEINTGQLASIKGRRAVYLYYASYGGGSGPLWAIEGVSVQFTTQEDWSYREGVCQSVSSEVIELKLQDGEAVTISIKEIGRYDQFHLPSGERFSFQEEDIILSSN